METIFEKATRNKLRFETTLGMLSTEQLWDLPINKEGSKKDLRTLAESLQSQLNEEPKSELDFFKTTTSKDPILQLKFDIVKHIVITKVAEAEAATMKKVKETQKQEIDALIKEKEQEEVRGKSLEELKKMRDAL